MKMLKIFTVFLISLVLTMIVFWYVVASELTKINANTKYEIYRYSLTSNTPRLFDYLVINHGEGGHKIKFHALVEWEMNNGDIFEQFLDSLSRVDCYYIERYLNNEKLDLGMETKKLC